MSHACPDPPPAMHSSATPPIPLSSPTAISWPRVATQGNNGAIGGKGISVRSPTLLAKPKSVDTVDWPLSPTIMTRQLSVPRSPAITLAPRLAGGGTPDPRRSLTVAALSPRGPAIAVLNASAAVHSPNASPTLSPPSLSPPTISPSGLDSSWSTQSSVASAATFSFQHHSVGSGDGLWLSPSPPVLPESSPRSALIARETLQQDSSSVELPYVSASCPVTPTHHHPTAAADSSAHHARAESQQHRHLPPCHPYMPSAMEIAAFASLGNSSMPSASPTNLSARDSFADEPIAVMDPDAPLTNGKEIHGPQGTGVECCGRSIFFQLPQSGISLAHRIIYITSIVLLLTTFAVMSFGRSFLASLPDHCDIILSWTLSCNIVVLSAMQVGQLAANFNVVGSLGIVHSWPSHVLKQARLGFVGAALIYYTGLLLYLAEGHKVIVTRRLTLEGGIGVDMQQPAPDLPAMSLLFPSAAYADHTGCAHDNRFGTYYISTLLLNLALWLFFLSLLVHLLSGHHRDSPAPRSAAAAVQTCSQCNGPLNTSKWGVTPGRIFSWMRGRSSNRCPACAYKHAAASSASVSPVNTSFVSGEVLWYIAPTPLQPVAPSSLGGRRGSSDRWFQRWLKNSWLDKLGALPGDKNHGRLANTDTEADERHQRSPSNPDWAAGVPLLSHNNSDSTSLSDTAPGRRSSSDGSPSPPASRSSLSPSSLCASGAFEVIFRRYVDRSTQHSAASSAAAEGDCFVCLLHDLTTVMRTNAVHLRRAKDMQNTGSSRSLAHSAGSRVQKHLV